MTSIEPTWNLLEVHIRMAITQDKQASARKLGRAKQCHKRYDVRSCLNTLVDPVFSK